MRKYPARSPPGSGSTCTPDPLGWNSAAGSRAAASCLGLRALLNVSGSEWSSFWKPSGEGEADQSLTALSAPAVTQLRPSGVGRRPVTAASWARR